MNRIILFIAVILATSFSSVAQKTGYVNVQELLAQLPEAGKARQDLEAYYTEMQNQFQSMTTEFTQKMQEYDSKANTWSEIVAETKEKEIRDIQTRIEEFQYGMEQKLQSKQEEIFAPLLEKVQNAIQQVAKEEAYDYIYDASALLYAKDEHNVINKIKVKLGIK